MSSGEEVIAALGGALAELAQAGRRSAAESTGRLLLAIDRTEARERFLESSAPLGDVQGTGLAGALLAVAERNRAGGDWPHWLDRIPAEVLARVANVGYRIDTLSTKLWSFSNRADKPLEGRSLDLALASLARLAEAAVTSGRLTAKAIVTSAAKAPVEDAAAERQGRELRLAERLAEASLVRGAQYAAPVLDSLGESIAQPLPEAGIDGVLARHVMIWGARLAPSADDASRDRLLAALGETTWLPAPYRATLNLAASIREDPGAGESPYGAGEIADLSAAHLSYLAEGLALWITHFGPDAGEVGRALVPLAGAALPSPVAEAIDRRFDRSAGEERAALVKAGVQEILKSAVEPDFLRSLGIGHADPDAVLGELIAIYGEGVGTNEDRETIMAVAAMLAPLPDPLRRRLILDLVIPIAHQGKGALDIALRHLDLCLPPPRGTKQKLTDTLRDRANGKDQEKRVDKALLGAGLIRRSGPFGRRRKSSPET